MKTSTPTIIRAVAICAAVSVASLLRAQSETPAQVSGTTTGVSKVVQIKGMDKAPKALTVVAPAYPEDLRIRGVQGLATVNLLIDSMGRVTEVTLVSATHPDFGKKAIEAAGEWTFEPASAKGQPITTRVQVPFQFVMPQVAAFEAGR